MRFDSNTAEGLEEVKVPTTGWVITGCQGHCDVMYHPHELFYLDLDWAIQDCKDINKDHTGHRVTAVKLTLKGKRLQKLKHS